MFVFVQMYLHSLTSKNDNDSWLNNCSSIFSSDPNLTFLFCYSYLFCFFYASETINFVSEVFCIRMTQRRTLEVFC